MSAEEWSGLELDPDYLNLWSFFFLVNDEYEKAPTCLAFMIHGTVLLKKSMVVLKVFRLSKLCKLCPK